MTFSIIHRDIFGLAVTSHKVTFSPRLIPGIQYVYTGSYGIPLYHTAAYVCYAYNNNHLVLLWHLEQEPIKHPSVPPRPCRPHPVAQESQGSRLHRSRQIHHPCSCLLLYLHSYMLLPTKQWDMWPENIPAILGLLLSRYKREKVTTHLILAACKCCVVNSERRSRQHIGMYRYRIFGRSMRSQSQRFRVYLRLVHFIRVRNPSTNYCANHGNAMLTRTPIYETKLSVPPRHIGMAEKSIGPYRLPICSKAGQTGPFASALYPVSLVCSQPY